jgi:Zn-dependent peptidase ImmA (M78 family)
MKEQPIAIPENLLLQLRKLLPKGPITFGTALIVADQQALLLRKLLQAKKTRMSFHWVEELPHVELEIISPYELQKMTGRPRVSGATKLKADGEAIVSISSGTSHTHKRFTLAHELKHLIDGHHTDHIYAQLGNGNDAIRDARIESVANEFAAHLLMPHSMVVKAWEYGIQGLSELAAHFDVSEDAMHIRLVNIGLVGKGTSDRSFLRAPRSCMDSN